MAPTLEAPTLASLRAAPSSAKVGTLTIVLSAYLWRDFMPPVPAGGRPLVATIVVATSDTAVAPPVELEAAWIINGEEVWKPNLQFDPLVDPYPNTILKVGRDGPKWTAGATVDVVVRVRDTAGNAHLIRKSAQVNAAY
jgi:hypothetical protein